MSYYLHRMYLLMLSTSLINALDESQLTQIYEEIDQAEELPGKNYKARKDLADAARQNRKREEAERRKLKWQQEVWTANIIHTISSTDKPIVASLNAPIAPRKKHIPKVLKEVNPNVARNLYQNFCNQTILKRKRDEHDDFDDFDNSTFLFPLRKISRIM